MTDPDYRFEPMTRATAESVASWRYDPPYDFYDLDADPEDYAAFLNPENWPDAYFAVHEGDDLVGFFSFEESDGVVEVGLGMAPDRTGRGEGRAFVQAGLAFARRRYDPSAFRLAVAAFNERAIRVYEAVGFRATERFPMATNGGEHEFIGMRRPVSRDGHNP